MRAIETELQGVLVIEPDVFEDPRGFFFENYHSSKFAGFGITESFVQDNHSRSCRGTLRGLHYQLRHPQAKLCRIVRGEVLDVAVDIRRGSPTFGKWVSVVLSEDNHRQIYIPAGFAHGFYVRSEIADCLYKCDAFYAPADQHGIAWDDPGLGIEWGLVGPPVLSAKDAANPRIAQIDPNLLPGFEG